MIERGRDGLVWHSDRKAWEAGRMDFLHSVFLDFSLADGWVDVNIVTLLFLSCR